MRALVPAVVLLVGCSGVESRVQFEPSDAGEDAADAIADAHRPEPDAYEAPDVADAAIALDAADAADATPWQPLGAPCDPAKGNVDCKIPSGVCIESHTPQYAVDMWHRCTLICSTPADKLSCQADLDGLCAGEGAPCLPAH